RLVGKGLQQLDLTVGERPGLGARHCDDADGSSLPQHGYPETASKADRAGYRAMLVLRIEFAIGYVDHRTLEDGASGEQRAGWARRVKAVDLLERFRGVVVLGAQMEHFRSEEH